ncbi:PP2C family protein-serine/threonine phosphatase [Azohydromonas caseinilytica]|uniref:Fused response regulator/phosphatase n=1 Tax=Azohydromonas caseinilytica TaxID=2728836 RepID=A0A848FBW2_9BURK|nr:fused response regulator/phosphatase [Azohydromonas caseinilytica]NML16406.1 fused response regulator/phosphatase [Azohydromonas caseinilytica]
MEHQPVTLTPPLRRAGTLRVMVVDDQPMQRLVVHRALTRLGHQVCEAASGEEALARMEHEAVDLVVSDWIMQGMDGLALCRALRARPGARYVYFILMSSRDKREDMIEGLAAGADDFLRKPVDFDELAVRLHAGQRLLELQAGLEERNRELQAAYQQIQRDVDAAGAFQKSLLPQETFDDGRTRFAWLFLPSRFVSGDALNCFGFDAQRVAFYNFDVAGHGVASAMVAMIVTQMLSPQFSGGIVQAARSASAASPAAVVQSLNARLLEAGIGTSYLTCVFGLLDQRNGSLRLVRAGHTLPVVVLPDGRVHEVAEDGDLPVGLFDDVAYHDIELTLPPGARLCCYTDGVTECEDLQGEPYGLERLKTFLSRTAACPAQDTVREFEAEIRRWAGGDSAELRDDISMLLIEHVGAGAASTVVEVTRA